MPPRGAKSKQYNTRGSLGTESSDTLDMVRLTPVLIGLGVAAAHALLRLTQVFPIGVFADDGIYVSLAQALAEGEGYRSTYAPGDPLHYKYPPGLPFVFAGIWKAAGGLDGFQLYWSLVTPLLVGASASAVFVLGTRAMRLPPWIVVALGVTPLVADSSLHYLNLPLSEGIFLLLMASAILLLSSATDHVADEDRTTDQAGVPTSVFAAGILVGTCFLFRSQALALLIGGSAALLYRRAWLKAGVFFLLGMIPWMGWSLGRPRASLTLQPDELPYADWVLAGGLGHAVSETLNGILTNTLAYAWILSGHLAPWTLVGFVLAGVLAVLFAMGLIVSIRTHPGVTLPVAATVVLILIWPWPQDRFLVTLLPFSGLLVARGLYEFIGRTRQEGEWKERVALVVVGVVLLSALPRQLQIREYAYAEYDASAHTRVAYPSLFLRTNGRFLIAASTWIQQNAETHDRIVTDLHGGVYLYTGRQSIPASPAQPTTGPTVFDTPGAYLASRILLDEATLVAAGNAASPIARDVQAISQSCPGAIETAGFQPDPAPVVFYRIRRSGSEQCLVALADAVPEIWR